MPDLEGRYERERELASALLVVFDEYRGRVSPLTPFPSSQFVGDVQAALAPTLASVHSEAAQQVLSGANAAVGSTRSDEWARAFAGVLALEISESSQRRLGGVPPEQFEDAAAAVFSPERAETIGITEVTRAISAGEAVATGIVGILGSGDWEWVWDATNDMRTCEVCRALHGTTRSVWISPPPRHPRCRCHLVRRAV